MSLWGHCQVSLVPKYRSWAERRLGALSINAAKLNGDLLGTHKFCCLAILSAWMLQCLGMRNAKIHLNVSIL